MERDIGISKETEQGKENKWGRKEIYCACVYVRERETERQRVCV